jgi:hypothetical protein
MAENTILSILNIGSASGDHANQLKRQAQINQTPAPQSSASGDHPPFSVQRNAPHNNGAYGPPSEYGATAKLYDPPQQPPQGYSGLPSSLHAPAPLVAPVKNWTPTIIEDALLNGQTDVLQHLRSMQSPEYEILSVGTGIAAVFVERQNIERAKVYILLDGFGIVTGSNRALINAWFDCPSIVSEGNATPQCERAAYYSGHHVVELYSRIIEGARLAPYLAVLKCQKGKLVAS